MKLLFFFTTLICWVFSAIGFFMGASFSIVGATLRPSKKYWYFHIARIFWARLLLSSGLVRVEVKGLDKIKDLPETGVIFVANHQSMADILLCSAYIPRYFVFILKEEILKVPFFGRYLKSAGNIPIRRAGIKKAYEPLMDAAERLNKGVSILLYPEGTRSKTGKVGEFKRGALYLAFHSGVPIVPLAIKNSRNVLKKGSFLIWPGKVELEFGDPVLFGEELKDNKEAQRQEAARLQQWVASIVESDLPEDSPTEPQK